MNSLADLSVKIVADGADLEGIFSLYRDPLIKGLTTNPTLMRKAGIEDYEAFAQDVLRVVKTKPISFEVFSDEFPEMKRQALKIRDWQENVFVKIPITNTRSESSIPLIKELAAAKGSAQRHGDSDIKAGPRSGRCPQPGRTYDRLCVRGAHRRYWRESRGYYAGEQSAASGFAKGQAPLGQCSRGFEHYSGGQLRMRYCHGAP
jgi:hypothetical protein